MVMRSRNVCLLCVGCLVLGVAFGAGWIEIPALRSARAVDSATAEKLYSELGRDSSPLLDGSMTLAKIARVTNPSVVHIQSERKGARGGKVEETGSGVIMAHTNGGFYVITNRHVIDGAVPEAISISLHDGRVIQPEKIWSDAQTDVAVMQLGVSNVVAARWGDSNRVEIGHIVLAMGSPFGLSRSVTMGIISAKGRRQLRLGANSQVLNQDFLQTDAAINPGNSGGPLIDLTGRVIGINTAIASSGGGNEGIGFSIPSNLVQRVMEQLLEYGVVHRAYLGVKLDPNFDAKGASRLRLDRVQGARITEVYPNTPAAKAGLTADDVVLTLDGVDVQDENHLINLVSLTPIGRQVKLQIWRQSRRVTISITLTDRSELQQSTDAREDDSRR